MISFVESRRLSLTIVNLPVHPSQNLTKPVGMPLAQPRSEMNREADEKLIHFSAIAFGPVFIVPTVRERRSKIFEVSDKSLIGRYPEASQPSTALDVVFLVLQLLLATAFLIVGATKLAGAQMQIETFERIGVGQWFRYFTGSVELIAAILIIVPRTVVVGAALLGATMVAAIETHLLVIGGSPGPALLLLALAVLVAWYRALYR